MSNATPTPIAIELLVGEMTTGIILGAIREHEGRSLNRKRPFDPSYDSEVFPAGFVQDMVTTCAEIAVAKATGRYHSGGLTLGASDVFGKIEVRHTRYHEGHLRLDKDDPDDACYVLVTGGLPTLMLRGWIPGVEAKVEEFWKNPNPKKSDKFCFWVPQTALHQLFVDPASRTVTTQPAPKKNETDGATS